MDLSIIIVSWNAKDYLRKCLATVAREIDGIKAETIVIDNQSSDGSPGMVRSEFPWVTMVESGGNLGFAKGNNRGIEIAGGRYLALINSDVEIEAGCLRTLIDYMEKNVAVGIAGPRVLNGDHSLQLSCRHRPALWRAFLRALALDNLFPGLTYPSHARECPVDVLSGCFWFVRRSAVEQVGGLDAAFFMYSEDVDWCRRFAEAGWKVMYVPAAQTVHHGGASSENAPTRFFLELYRANFQYCRKHRGPAAEIILKGIALLHHSLRVLGGLVGCVAGRKTGMVKVKRSTACLNWILHGCRPLTE